MTDRPRPALQPIAAANRASEQAASDAAFSDDALVARVRAGEIELYELLMRRHNERVYRVARAVLRDDDEAEDVLQETWVRAYRALPGFEGRASFATWASRIALHEALARRRRRGRVVQPPALAGDPEESDTMDHFASPLPDPEATSANRELARILEHLVDALPESQRVVFVLREVQGLSTAETAASLELSEEAVKVRLHRARARLRGDLTRRAGGAIGASFGFHAVRCDRVVASVFERIGGGPVAADPRGEEEPA